MSSDGADVSAGLGTGIPAHRFRASSYVSPCKMNRMSLELFNLSGRVAVVMGGTSGIGRVLALSLAEAGADVVSTGRRENLVAEVAAGIEKLGRKTLRLTTDASSRPSIDALRDA